MHTYFQLNIIITTIRQQDYNAHLHLPFLFFCWKHKVNSCSKSSPLFFSRKKFSCWERKKLLVRVKIMLCHLLFNAVLVSETQANCWLQLIFLYKICMQIYHICRPALGFSASIFAITSWVIHVVFNDEIQVALLL